MQPISTQPFVDLIAATLGLRVREQEENALGHKLLQRIHALGLPSLEVYYQLLMTGHEAVVQDAEWLQLINALTINESYFFRDQGQFALLRQRVLPELIQAKQLSGLHPHRTLRVWSAGCSTGEEAYSLAILLKELIPAEQTWKVMVLGTDINESSLAQAKQGIYSNWSFRSVNPDIQKKYFQPHGQGWEVIPEIRSLVTFQLGNLVQDGCPQGQFKLHQFDLILCRNVFIYFNPTAIATVLEHFYHALVPKGYLITGHTELHGQNLGQFQIRTFPESVLYQRPRTASLEALPLQAPSSSSLVELPKLLPPSPKPANLPPQVAPREAEQLPSEADSIRELKQLIRSKAYARAIEIARQLIERSPHCFQAYYFMAEAYANSGDYPNAVQTCQKVLELSPFAVEPIYLLAQISQERGDLEQARKLLRQVIYLVPSSVYAYFELGCLYEQQGNMARAYRNWQSALEGLQQLEFDATVDFQARITAAELQAVLEQKLNQRMSI